MATGAQIFTAASQATVESVGWHQVFDNMEAAPDRLILGKTEDLGLYIKQSQSVLPRSFVSWMEDDVNGHCGSNFNNNSSAPISYDVWCCFKIKSTTAVGEKEFAYGWHQPIIFVRWFPKSNTKQVICLDIPSVEHNSLLGLVFPLEGKDPFTVVGNLGEEISRVYERCFWNLRDHVRKQEIENRNSALTFKGESITKPITGSDSKGTAVSQYKVKFKKGLRHVEPSFVDLHEFSRHLSHSNETLAVALDTMSMLFKQYDLFLEELDSEQMDVTDAIKKKVLASKTQVKRGLYAFERNLKGHKERSESLQDRLQNAINLAVHIVAQRNSRMARSDNVFMKTIALVSLVYLPGTFVSGVFGMNFFDFEPQSPDRSGWAVSDKFWIYWVTTGCLTAGTVVTWAILHFWKHIARFSMHLWEQVKGPSTQGRLI